MNYYLLSPIGNERQIVSHRLCCPHNANLEPDQASSHSVFAFVSVVQFADTGDVLYNCVGHAIQLCRITPLFTRQMRYQNLV